MRLTGYIVLSFLIAAFVGYGMYAGLLSYYLNDVDKKMLEKSIALKAQLSTNFFDELVDQNSVDDATHAHNCVILQKFVEQHKLANIYVMTTDKDKVVFVLSNGNEEQFLTNTIDEYWLEYKSVPQVILEVFADQNTRFEEYEDSYGSFRSSFLYFENKDKRPFVIGVDIDLKLIETAKNVRFWWSLAAFVLIWLGMLWFSPGSFRLQLRRYRYSLLTRTALFVIVALEAIVLLMYLFEVKFITADYVALERIELESKMKLVRDALHFQALHIAEKAESVAIWPQAQDYLKRQAPDFVTKHLSLTHMRSLHTNLVAFFDKEGAPMLIQLVNLHKNEVLSADLPSMNEVLSKCKQANILQKDSVLTGMVRAGEHEYLVAFVPVIENTDQATLLGYLAFGILLDQEFIDQFAARQQIDVRFIDVQAALQTSKYKEVISNFSATNTIVLKPENESFIFAYQLEKDIFGQQNILIRLMSARKTYEQSNKLLNGLMIGFILIGFFILVVVLIILRITVLRRLAILSREMQAIDPSGRFESTITESGKDEITFVSQTVNKLLTNIFKSKLEIEQQGEELKSLLEMLNKKNHNITSSINYAKQIQQAMLPTDALFRDFFERFFIYFRPRDIVSGDFYWLTQSGQSVILAVADCTGHGVPGAFMSLIGNSMLNKIVRIQGITRPDLVLNRLHIAIKEMLKQDQTQNRDGMDIVLVEFVYNQDFTQIEHIRFAGAKNGVLVIKNKVSTYIKGDKMPIGGRQKEAERIFSLNEIAIDQQPMSLYLFTDGIQDQFGGPSNRKFSLRELQAVLEENSEKDCISQLETIDRVVNDWKQGYAQIDDMLLIGIEVFGKKS